MKRKTLHREGSDPGLRIGKRPAKPRDVVEFVFPVTRTPIAKSLLCRVALSALFLVCLAGLLPCPAKAAQITSNGGFMTAGPLAGAKPVAGVTADACGYSTVANIIGTINNVTLTQTKGGVTSMSTVTPAACMFAVKGVNFAGMRDNKRTKLPAGVTFQSADAASTAVNAAKDMAKGFGIWTADATGSTLTAAANVNPAKTGTAAGHADDPYTVAAGSYPYSVTINSLLLQDVPGGMAIAEFDARSDLSAGGKLWNLIAEIDPAGTLCVTFKSFSPLALGISDMSIGNALKAHSIRLSPTRPC
jgi:hypothetical protein